MEAISIYEPSLRELEIEIQNLKKQVNSQKLDNKVCIICFSGDWDRLFAALSIASSSLAIGKEVHLFFTFWAVSALRKKGKQSNEGNSFVQKIFTKILPSSINRAPLSQFNMFGMGKHFMKGIMDKKGVDDIDVLFDDVKELGAKIHVCDTSTELFGIKCTELVDGDKMNICGVTTFLSQGLNSQMTLFI